MATALTIGTVPLEEIHDLHWPTDRHLVESFRKTLQHGGHFAPMHLNRIWQPESAWRYEVIDGFHRYEAAKAEGVPALLCQVVEINAQEARYARIQACVGKPSEVTRERALRELRLAFINDMRSVIGNPAVLYEPLLGEDGRVQARPRALPLPEEPLAALEALTDHLLATQQAAFPAPRPSGPQRGPRTLFGQRTGWEQQLTDWLADLGERFGYDATWLLQELHLHVLQEQGLGQGWSTRERDAFQRQGGYAFHALWLWHVPDVELRAWLRRQIQAHPEQSEWLWKALMLLGFTTAPQPGKPFQTLPKSALLALLNRHPNPRDLYLALRDRQAGPPHDSTPTMPPPPAAPPSLPPPPKASPPVARQELPPPISTESSQASSVFTVVSPTFGQPPPRPVAPVTPPTVPPSAKQPAAQSASISPLGPQRPDPVAAYQPVHNAFLALLQAIERLSTQYGRAWLQWEHAQADLAHLRAILTSD
ncbi:MAG TPA: ParB N-terminal domain-containing protein [Ktedonobacteraceae bacterium]|nr:ParB N-terminal domain-containing protein [Ktedonobacteraceae bacterium]